MTISGGSTPPELAWLQALRDPSFAQGWSLAEWQRVVRLARRLRLLARLGEALARAGLLDSVAAPARRHLLSEQRISRWRLQTLTWALERIEGVLADTAGPRVLLKGAAYIGQGLPIAPGRLPSDIDILVPKAQLDDALRHLEQAGWQATELDAHDQRYYREWSHEVPPMRHELHPVELDLHHNILPPVARTRVDAGLLLARLQPSAWPGWQVLHPVDQVLHSAAHLFHDSELRDRVRDLVDLDALMRHFGAAPAGGPAFWDELPRRAAELGLTESLAWATHFCIHWLGTPVPDEVARRIAAQGPGALRRAVLLPLFAAVLRPTEPDDRPALSQRIAADLLLARYHLHRMPLRLLLPHLWHKFRAQPAAAPETDPPFPRDDRA